MKTDILRAEPKIECLHASAYRIPTDYPESDGTLEWNATTLVVAEVSSANETGIGYTYADSATANLVNELLAKVVEGRDAMAIPVSSVSNGALDRNLGRRYLVDGHFRRGQCAVGPQSAHSWFALGDITRCCSRTRADIWQRRFHIVRRRSFVQTTIRMGAAGYLSRKNENRPRATKDAFRVAAARKAIGSNVELFVDANGAYTRKQALEMAERFREWNVSWFEEPVSSDDLDGLHLLRDRSPAGMNIAAGEYEYDLPYFERMLASGAVDVLQADATRCAGITGFLQVAALCEARSLPLSAHCGPSIHVHPCCAARPIHHIEYFHDHVRIEHMLFDGALTPQNGQLKPDLSRTGCGLEFKHTDAEKYKIST